MNEEPRGQQRSQISHRCGAAPAGEAQGHAAVAQLLGQLLAQVPLEQHLVAEQNGLRQHSTLSFRATH